MTVKAMIDTLENYRRQFGDDVPVYVCEDKDDDPDYLVDVGEVNLHVPITEGKMYISVVERFD